LAVSISQDIKLRQTIRKSAIEESKLLDSIGSADMELQIQKKVMTVTKDLLENTIDKSGIQPSITEDDMKQYLGQVLSEVKKQKTSTRKQQESQG
jgi:hypothetical protein